MHILTHFLFFSTFLFRNMSDFPKTQIHCHLITRIFASIQQVGKQIDAGDYKRFPSCERRKTTSNDMIIHRDLVSRKRRNT